MKYLSYCVIYILICFSSTAFSQQLKPNVVLIVSDDHGTDALGSYGNPVIKTPNLDALANDGTRFTSAFCTSASCSPSRSVILTGLHNHSNGMYGLAHDFHKFSSKENLESLPNILSANGYRTARVGKYHLAPEQVFHFEETLSKGTANDPASIGRSPVEMAELCLEFISKKSEVPFFLFYATDDPHRSNKILPNGQVDFNSFPEPNDFGNRKEGYPGVKEVKYSPEEVIVPSYLPDTKESRAELAQYYQSTSRMDQGVGKLLEILKASGQYDNTLIIYISDNGPAFPAAKTTLYDPGIRLPCIVKAPGQVNHSKVQEGLISWADITPTILDYAQASVDPKNFHGRSFRPLMENKGVEGWDDVYGSHSLHEITMYYPMRMIRNKKYKLIYNIAHQLPYPFALDLQYSPTWISVKNSTMFGKREKEKFINRPKFELYDLETDPDELNNLAENQNYQQVLEDMIGKIRKFQASTNDPWVHKWDYE